jgi:hypothetical protein
MYGNGHHDCDHASKRKTNIMPGIAAPQAALPLDHGIGREALCEQVALLIGQRPHVLRGRAGFQPMQCGTHVMYGRNEGIRNVLYKLCNRMLLSKPNHRKQRGVWRRSALPCDMVAFARAIFLDGKHTIEKNYATNGTERPGKRIQSLHIRVKGCAEVGKLLCCKTTILPSSRLVPGAFTDRAVVEQVPAAFQCWHSVLPQAIAKPRFGIIKAFWHEMPVENEGIIWYHKSDFLLPSWEKTNGGSLVRVSRLLVVDLKLSLEYSGQTSYAGRRSRLMHINLLWVQKGHFL